MNVRKLRSITAAAALGASLGLALPAAAGHDDAKPGAETRGRYATARVVRVEPIVRVVRVSEPRRRCWDEDYVVRYHDHERGRGRGHGGTAGSAILGGIIGGAVGNAFGDGKGRDAATLAGVLIGSSIGHDRALRDDDRYDRDQRVREEVRSRERCEVDDRWREEERIEGYDVTYEFQGERYRSRMSHDPGDELKVWVSVRPVGE